MRLRGASGFRCAWQRDHHCQPGRSATEMSPFPARLSDLSGRSLVFQALVTKYIHRHTQVAFCQEYAWEHKLPPKEPSRTMNSKSFSLIHPSKSISQKYVHICEYNICIYIYSKFIYIYIYTYTCVYLYEHVYTLYKYIVYR